MSESLYAIAAESLKKNDEQFEAYESEGNCVVLAGPGAGKTKTMTIKLARLLEEEVRAPQRLACITYSNACVGEIRGRLKKLGVAEDGRLHLATVHSFCLTQLVLPYARLAGLEVPDPLVVASPTQSRQLFEKAHLKTLGSPAPKWFRMESDKLRRTIVDQGSKEWKNWNGLEPPVVEANQRLLLENGMIDFDGIVLTSLRLIEGHNWVRQCIRAKFPIIVIDEYQDLGLPLHRMVLALMNEAGVRMIAVGDPDQSIYGFTGAQPWLLKELAALPNVQAVRLKLNYRCGDQIIAASKMLLPDPSEFKSHDGRKGTIIFYQLGCDTRGQAEYALERLVPTLLKENEKWRPGDIAVLYRTLNEGNSAAAAADKLGYEYFRLDNGSPIKRTRVTEWLTDCARWCAGGWETGSVTLGEILKGWRGLRRSLTREADVLAARAKLISFLFATRDGAMSLQKWLASISETCVNDIFAEEPGVGDEQENFEELRGAAKTGGKLSGYTVETFGNQGRSPDQINLMTLHSSKGLEFQAVIMINLEEGAIPSTYDKTKEAVEEAGRLFYVGLTRAMSSVHLIYAFNESPLVTQVRKAT
jgi:ATP-dependent DNA helicase Rep/DNA helicase-2/ATP-dependent DNA helicase PcrA